MERALLPRISSNTSGFFFCGIIEEPTGDVTVERHEPELGGGEVDDVGGQPAGV